MDTESLPVNAAEALLTRMKKQGVDFLFANGGTDFAPLIEGLARGKARGADLPEALIMPHETAAVAMAHGYYLMTGRAQAVMVHVNVGLANCVMGLINAASDNIPMLMMAGRTPLTEHGRLGARMTPIQYGQEMRDQSGMVRELVKWDYEMRYGEQAELLIDRALTIARSEPLGPVFLALPREPLAESEGTSRSLVEPRQVTPAPPAADAEAIDTAAAWLREAKNPLIICQRGDPAGRLGRALGELARHHALAVSEYWPVRNVLENDHPMHLGYDAAPYLGDRDVVLVLDCQVPWIARNVQPMPGAKIIHAGPDPLFQRLPVRSFQSDLAITGRADAIVEKLDRAMRELGGDTGDRAAEISAQSRAWRQKAREDALAGGGSPMTPAFVSHCIGEAMDPDAVLINEMGAVAAAMNIAGPNRFFSPPYSGGLGWGLPAALGAKLADRQRMIIACIGDGAYSFANPVACHQIAQALDLPVLTVLLNNGIWNAVGRAVRMIYPDGAALRMNEIPITSLEPSPDFGAIIGASGGWSEDVDSGADLPDALARGLAVVRDERRQALLNVKVSP